MAEVAVDGSKLMAVSGIQKQCLSMFQSGFLERGRPRPLNPPLMQTELVWLGFKGEQDVFVVSDCRLDCKSVPKLRR